MIGSVYKNESLLSKQVDGTGVTRIVISRDIIQLVELLTKTTDTNLTTPNMCASSDDRYTRQLSVISQILWGQSLQTWSAPSTISILKSRRRPLLFKFPVHAGRKRQHPPSPCFLSLLGLRLLVPLPFRTLNQSPNSTIVLAHVSQPEDRRRRHRV